MKAIETTATIDASGQLTLDRALSVTKPQQVRIIILMAEDDESDPDEPRQRWLLQGFSKDCKRHLPDKRFLSLKCGKALMPNEPFPIQIALTPRFKRDLRDLAKRYRSIRTDLQPIIAQLQASELPGDRIAGINHQIFKVRLKNSNIQKGKSGGDRVIYYLKTEESIILTTIYSKSDRSDVSNEIIEAAIAQYEQGIQIVNGSDS